MTPLRFLLSLTIVASLAASAPAQAQAQDYSTQIAPLFAKFCNGCHNGTDAEGGLILESYDQLRKGGKRGAEIEPGKSDESRLILVLEGKARPKMPPKDNPAPAAEQVGLLRAWIDAGAPGPTAGAAALAAALVTPRIELAAPPRLAIYSTAFSPDGKWIALGRQGEVEILSAETRSPLKKISGLPGPVNALAFTADGSRFIAASGEPGLFGEARLWTLHGAATGAEAQSVFRGHRDALYAVAISFDGKTTATAGYDAEIRLWDSKSGAELRTLKGHNGAVFDVAFRPGGAIGIIASASADRTVKIWNVASGARLDTFSQPLKDQNTVAFSPDGKRLAAGGADNRIRVWQISENGLEGSNPILLSRFAHEGAILRLAFSADGRFLASSADDRTVKIWDAASLTERQLLERQPDWPVALAFSADGQTLVVGRLDGTVGFYHAPTGQPARLSSAWPRAGRAVVTAIAGAVALAAFADPPPKAEVTSILPRGIRIGTRAAFRISGKNLLQAKELKLSNAKLAGRILDDPAPRNDEIWAQLDAEADLERSGVDLWLAGASGESNRIKVFADDLPQILESEPNDADIAAADLTPLPVTFWGSFDRRGDVDFFPFDATAGETIVLDVEAASLGSKSNAVLAVCDAAGRVVAASNDFDGGTDPLIAFRAPVAGRFHARVTDLEMNASPDHFYRLTIGAFPFVTGCFPLGVPAGAESEIELTGDNVPPGTKVRVKPDAPGDVVVPIDPARFRSRRELRVTASKGPEIIESEPNDRPADANRIPAPGVVNGRIRGTASASSDVDLFRFSAKSGQSWIIETEAARRGSPIDTRIEVLDLEGRAVPRIRLQAVRDSYLTFRGIDSSQASDFRIKNWEEMELNQLLYLQGEVVKLFRAPQGPDSGFVVYELNGKRRTFFDTSATVHALDATCYIVETHPPGTPLVPNGLPVFDLPFTNDDDGDRALGADSRVTFTPPADGDYLVRVTDANGQAGDRYAYRLILREAQPGFHVTLNGANPTVAAGSGRGFSVSAARTDGFDGEITVRIAGLPPGFIASSPLVIQAGHVEAQGTVFAALDAPQPSVASGAAIQVTAEAVIDGRVVQQAVNGLGTIHLDPKPKLLVRLEPVGNAKDITIEPGQMVPAMLKVERNGHDDLITFQVDNLPHGIIVDDIGLSGVLIRKGENERQIFLAAAKWVPETDRLCHAVENQVGGQTSPPVMLHVRKGAVAAAR